jgi:small subunit ribosomal protein S4e
MAHIKRYAAPKTWKLKRKTGTFVIRVSPGPHKQVNCVPLGVVLRDMLNVVSIIKDAKRILNGKHVKIDGVVRKRVNYPVGIMDVVEIDKLGAFRMVFNKNGNLTVIKSPKEESSLKLCKIISKTAVKGGKIQLGLHDGRNVLLSKTEGSKYKNRGTLLIKLPSQEIKEYFPLEKGAIVYIIGGKHVGEQAKIVDFAKIKGSISEPRVSLKAEGVEYETPVSYAFAVGKTKSELKLNE